MLRALIFGVALARIPAFFWGLPNVDGWDDDGVAPRDVLSGVVATYTPGDFYIYPPLHLLFVTLLTSPYTVWRLAKASAFTPEALVRAFVDSEPMTVYAVAARALSVLMGCLTIAILYDGARRIVGKPGARVAAAFAAIHASFAYYMHTSNLDGPLLFWCVLAWRELVCIVEGDETRWRRAALATAAALATKDQAYATLALPMLFTVVHAFRTAAAGKRVALAGRIAKEAVLAVGLLLVVDGAFVNPSGFSARMAALRGSASQDYRDYVPGLLGTYAILRDSVCEFPRFLPPEVGVLGAMGVVAAFVRAIRERSPVAPSLLAPLASLSFFLLFNLVARRTQERFLLSSTFFLLVPASAAFVELFWRRESLRAVAYVLLGLIVFRGAREVLAVEFSFLHDPRAAVEDYLRAYASPGDRVEVYGNNVYLPRIPDGLQGERVGPTEPKARPYVPSLREVQAPYAELEKRSPEWVVIPEAWAWQWLQDPVDERTGRWSAPVVRESLGKRETQLFFRQLIAGLQGYERIAVGGRRGFWGHVNMHATLNRPVFLLRRR